MSEVLFDVEVAGEEEPVEFSPEAEVEALPGMVAAATKLKTPTATTEPAAIQVVRSLSRPIATSRALIRASLEFIAGLHHLTPASEDAEMPLRTSRPMSFSTGRRPISHDESYDDVQDRHARRPGR